MRPGIICLVFFSIFSICNGQSNLQFTSTCEDVSKCVDAICNIENSIIQVEAITDCDSSSFLLYSYSVDLNNDNFIDLVGSSNNFFFPSVLGIHRVVFDVSDQCGNVISCESIVEIMDCTAPFGNCIITGISQGFGLSDTSITINANQFSFGFIDNCIENSDLIYSFSDTSLVPSITFSCEDIFQNSNNFEVDIYISDLSGNQTSCPLTILINDGFGNCNLELFDSIPICVTTSDFQPLEDVIINNNILLTDDPNSDCKWFIPEVGFVGIAPSRSTNQFNGITLLDLILLRKHILGIQPIVDPYKLVAADANVSGNISAFDLVLLSRAILRIDPSFSSSWFFIDANFEFPSNPFEIVYPNSILVSDIDTTEYPLEFIGVKAGDLDCSVDITEQTNGFLKPPVGTLTFCADDRMLSEGDTVEIPIHAKNFNEVEGFIFTLVSDPSKLRLIDVIAEEIPFDLSFANSNIAQHATFWIDVSFSGPSFSEEDTLFNLIFKVQENGWLSDAFTIDGSMVEMDAYNVNEERLEVVFEFCSIINAEENLEPLLEVEVYPNPFNDYSEIRFLLLESEYVTLNFFDSQGRKIKSFSENFPSGQNSFLIKSYDLPGNGLYFFEVKTAENIGLGKLVKN